MISGQRRGLSRRHFAASQVFDEESLTPLKVRLEGARCCFDALKFGYN
jgi:hypothetical protein